MHAQAGRGASLKPLQAQDNCPNVAIVLFDVPIHTVRRKLLPGKISFSGLTMIFPGLSACFLGYDLFSRGILDM